jgi:hypothetical protein
MIFNVTEASRIGRSAAGSGSVASSFSNCTQTNDIVQVTNGWQDHGSRDTCCLFGQPRRENIFKNKINDSLRSVGLLQCFLYVQE